MKKTIITLVCLFLLHTLSAQLTLSSWSEKNKTPPPLSQLSTNDNTSFSFVNTEKKYVSNTETKKLSDILVPSDTFNPRRFWFLVGTGSSSYVGSILLLNNLWYAQYPRSSFHLFNDEGEWMQVDKAGHFISAYQASKWVYGAMRWSGMKNKNAAWFGMAVGTTFQATIEVLDGFSEGWGFSWADITANTAGCALFGLQQAAWNEQRMVIKVSNTPRKYPLTPVRSIDGSKTTTIRTRTNDLYGDNYTQTFFKDYNALIFWLSVNPRSFHPNSRLPEWLNVAIGYGADNMYGGYKNEWPAEAPEFRLSDVDYPRYRQFYLSLDIDLSRIKTKSKFIKTLARTFNFVKIPSPTVEFSTLGKVKFHPLLF
ncbi:MAG: DUF2279 domain-containing protein [Saprospiraceae bacterium]|nr:DUF2279 domain-containing protein [Saprospiraceae bacterium]